MDFEHVTIREFLDSLAAKSPTPGGGAVAGLLTALAVALAQMVVNYSVGKKTLAAHKDANREALRSLTRHSSDALQLADDDAKAYARLNDILKLKDDDPQRAGALPEAVNAAIDAPTRVMQSAIDVLHLMKQLCGRTNAMLKSDLAIAAVIAEAAARAAAWNVRINLPLLNDESEISNLKSQIDSSLEMAKNLSREVETRCT
jgi:formiminotetrahydrofolate cyclodeaminase